MKKILKITQFQPCFQAYIEVEWPHVNLPLRSATQRQDKVVFLLVDDVPEEATRPHPELAQLLKTSPTVRWGEPGFLNKLRHVLDFWREIQKDLQNLAPNQRQSAVYCGV